MKLGGAVGWIVLRSDHFDVRTRNYKVIIHFTSHGRGEEKKCVENMG